MKNKKLLISIIILIAVVVLIATFMLFGKKDKHILIAEETNMEEVQDEVVMETELEVAKLALTLLEDGKVNLYSIDTDEMISQVDLAQIYSENNGEGVGTDASNTEPIVDNSGIYRSIKNDSNEFFIFYNEKSNKLFSVKTEGGALSSELLLDGIDVTNLNTIWANNEVAYLTFKDKTELIKYDLTKEEVTKEAFALEGVPTALAVKNDCVYYAYADKLAKLDTIDKKTVSVLLGDRSNDVVLENDVLYVVNDFGSGKNNSILIKINPEDLKVEGIIELKGAKSELIGINNAKTVLYVVQNGEEYNVKSVDLTKFKPMYSYNLIKDRYFKSYDNALYYQEGNTLKVHSLKTNEAIKDITIDGTLINIK